MILKEGISHIEDIKTDDFINWIERIVNYEDQIRQSIKVDGVQNISFSIVDGKIYGQRLSKNQLNIKKSHLDWSTNPIYNFIRSQHKTMELVYKNHKKIFNRYFSDSSFECEIVPPKYGNVLKYNNKYGILIFLRPMGGKVIIDGKEYETKKISDITFNKFVEEITKEVHILKFEIKQYYIDEKSKTSINLISKIEKEEWGIEKIDTIEDLHVYLDDTINKQIKEKIETLKKFLDKPIEIMEGDEKKTYTQKEIDSINLSKVKMQYRDDYRYYREMVQNQITDLKNEIKSLLLKSINKKVELDKEQDIEGIVFRDVKSNEMVKLIDRDYFTKINRFLWEPVQKLSRTTGEEKGIRPQFIKNIESLFGKTYKQILNSYKHQNHLDSLISYVNDINENDIDSYIVKIKKYVNDSITRINEIIDDLDLGYKEDTKTITLKKFGDEEKEVKYDDHLYNRFRNSLLIEKKWYLDLYNLLDEKRNSLVKLISSLYYIFENQLLSESYLLNRIED